MTQTSLTATYSSHLQTQDQTLQKQVNLFAIIDTRLPTSSPGPKTNTNSDTVTNAGGSLKKCTETKHQYLSALRSAASKVQEDINALLTAEMQTDKIRNGTESSNINGRITARSDGHPDAKKRQGEPQGKLKETTAGEQPDDDVDDGLEDGSDEDV